MLKNRLCIIAYFCNVRSLLLLFLLLSTNAKAQINNLVANPSFEDYLYCPNGTTEIESAEPWFQPLPLSTTDYFNVCCSIPDFTGSVGVPSNGIGFQYARSGNAYAGFKVYGGPGSLREYLEGTLTQPLEANKKYCVDFYYCQPEATPAFFSSLISIYFSNEPVYTNTNSALPFIPQVSDFAIFDTVNWVKASGSFTAGGGELFLTIGNFIPSFNEDGVNYSFIDDVSIYLCDDTLPKPPKEIKIPNVFTPDNDELNEQFVIENLPEGASVQVYNRWGELVTEWNVPNGSWDGRMKGGAEASAGVYYYIVNLASGERKKGFIQLIR